MHEQLTLDGAWCQRWRDRAPSWRPTSEGGFNPRRYAVRPVGEADARTFVTTHHYSRAYPAASMRLGLFDGGRLVGVAVLGVPMSRAVLTGPFPTLVPYRQALELSRLVLLDEVPANAESWFVARVFAYAAGAGVRGVVAFSDPMPRHVAGVQVMPGHVGTVYKALNGRYTGRGRARTLTLLPDGRVLSDRTRAKLVNGERGWAGALAGLVAAGAPLPTLADEPLGVWLPRALVAMGARRVRHRGNHRYVWALGDRGARRRTPFGFQALPFPTEPDLS
jgi:hypothetical protein